MQDLLYEQKVKELDTLICHFGCYDLCQGQCKWTDESCVLHVPEGAFRLGWL